jgi:23S rRNA (pseudouridine1915-N3)-methyltransferase
MVVYLVAVGRLKSAPLREACQGYQQRSRRYMKFEVREVRDGSRRDDQAHHARRIEGESLLRAVPSDALLVALTRDGQEMTSGDFARHLEEWQRRNRDVAFVIGGAHGLDAAVLDAADQRLSLSPMTLPHEIARLTLLEQLYRACTIIRGEPYHKGG